MLRTRYNGGLELLKYDSIINVGPVRARPSHVGVAFEMSVSLEVYSAPITRDRNGVTHRC